MTIFIVVTETVDIVCWLAIYLYLVRLLVFDCGPQARDLDLLILRGGSYYEPAARGRRVRESAC